MGDVEKSQNVTVLSTMSASAERRLSASGKVRCLQNPFFYSGEQRKIMEI